MAFLEHNNREKAKKFAEFITGQELRKHLAGKVEKYCGKNPSVFDGAAGSGQLEQYVEPKLIYGVEIQPESCEAFKKNYPTCLVFNQSFFEFHNDVVADCVVMNPPFSMKFKELSEVEQQAIKAEFPWKKSGVVDDIFILKSLNYTSRYAFHICFCGVAYRNTEKKMRELIGNQLTELNVIKNAFDDTQIDVLFLVIDKQKTDNSYQTSIYDCKAKETLLEAMQDLNSDFDWQIARVEVEQEKLSESDIDEINLQLNESAISELESHLQLQLLVFKEFNAKVGYQNMINKLRKMLSQYEKQYHELQQDDLFNIA